MVNDSYFRFDDDNKIIVIWIIVIWNHGNIGEINTASFKKMPFCLDLNMLMV